MSNWILDYVTAIDQSSEAPLNYNIWAAISVVGSVLKKNVWLNYKDFVLYPNHYIVLVGPPGIGKSSSIHPAHSFPKALKLANYMSDRVTAPRIIEKLFQGFSSPLQVQAGQVLTGGKDSTVTLMSSELPILLNSSDWMLQFLCDAWERGEFDYDTKNKGSFTVDNMCVSLIGACTTDFIRKLSKDSDNTISSGFTARTIFVNAKGKSKSLPWAQGFRLNPAFQPLIQDLEAKLVTISNLRGEFTLDPYARALWEKFYKELDDSLNEDDTDILKNFKSRQGPHVLKLAMVLTAAEGTGLVINHAILTRSIGLINNIAAGVDEIFRGVGEAQLSASLARIQLYLERKGSASYNQMLKDNMRFIDHDDLVKVLKILELTGFLTSVDQGGIWIYTWTGQPVNPNSVVRP